MALDLRIPRSQPHEVRRFRLPSCVVPAVHRARTEILPRDGASAEAPLGLDNTGWFRTGDELAAQTDGGDPVFEPDRRLPVLPIALLGSLLVATAAAVLAWA